MNRISVFIVSVLIVIGCNQPKQIVVEETIKDVYANEFLIGTAVSSYQLEHDSAALALVNGHFNAIVAENSMKSANIHPQQNVYDFANADKFVEFGEANNKHITGHTLVWHSQAPDWLFVDEHGNDVSRDTLIARMRDHIYTVVGRYKGRIQGWDVVNEAIDDQGGFRKTKWNDIIGDDYVKLAFQFAHEADSNAELYYNDYSLFMPTKRDDVINLVNSLQAEGIRIDGIGMQGHYAMGYPSYKEFEDAVAAFSKTGLKVMVTEFDITLLPRPQESFSADISLNYEAAKKYNPYAEALPDSVMNLVAQRYSNFFQILLQYKESVSRVTFWGVADQYSWLNNWPIEGRTDYPLLFNRNYQPKPIYDSLLNLVN